VKRHVSFSRAPALETAMDIIDPAIDRYLHALASPDDPVLREMELLAAERSFPIVGPQVGALLQLLACASRARRVIELGSGFGYSAYWFARAVGPEGRVTLTDTSADNAAAAERFLRRGGLLDRVRIEVGDALSILERIGGEYDVVFCDIDKERYPEVLEPAAAALRPGGLLICDNMLWFGAVLEHPAREASTRGVKELTRRLYDSPDFRTVLLPLRDGVSVSIYRAG
jgi:predicted O-methyltransferase YrrM